MSIHNVGSFTPPDSIGRTDLHEQETVQDKEKPTLQRSPLTLTGLPRPKSSMSVSRGESFSELQRKASEPLKTEVAPQDKRTLERLNTGKANLTEAQQAARSAAGRSFAFKLAGAVVSLIGVGVAAALTALSFGGAVPVLAVSCVSATVAIADAACAFKDWRSKANGGEGLPMGGNSIGNLTYAIARKAGASDEAAKNWGTGVSTTAKVGLIAASLATGFVAASAPVWGKIATTVATGVDKFLGVISGPIQQPADTEAAKQKGVESGKQAAEEQLRQKDDEIAELRRKLAEVPQRSPAIDIPIRTLDNGEIEIEVDESDPSLSPTFGGFPMSFGTDRRRSDPMQLSGTLV